ncbi:MAG TPA: Dabb family protein [Ktedonobacterales bacterium]
MIRHEVIIRVKPGVSRERIDQALRQARDLAAAIPGIERVRTGANNAPEYRHAMVVFELRDEMALHRMRRHPAHARAVRAMALLAESTAVGSYLITSDKAR